MASPSPFIRKEVISLTVAKTSEGAPRKLFRNIRGTSKKRTLVFHSQWIFCMSVWYCHYAEQSKGLREFLKELS